MTPGNVIIVCDNASTLWSEIFHEMSILALFLLEEISLNENYLQYLYSSYLTFYIFISCRSHINSTLCGMDSWLPFFRKFNFENISLLNITEFSCISSNITESSCILSNIHTITFTKIIVKWLAHLHFFFFCGGRRVQISASKLAVLTGFLWASPVPPGICRSSASNYAVTASFHIHSNLLFTKHLSFHAMWSELLTASLNKPSIN
jgi:hypothetical protein